MIRLTARLERPDAVGQAFAAMALAMRQGIAPGEVSWRVGDALDDLFAGAAVNAADLTEAAGEHAILSGSFRTIAGLALLHRDERRFADVHALAAAAASNPGIIEDSAHPLVRRVEALAKAVRRDRHKMTAFVRFRELRRGNERPLFMAWFEPDNHILRLTAPFFARRFATMRWAILTPGGTVRWDLSALSFSDVPASRAEVPADDAPEALWLTYYASTFNPARLKLDAMRSEMPVRYWRNLPEARLIRPLARAAAGRASALVREGAELPARAIPQHARYQPPAIASGERTTGLAAIREGVAGCRRCPLHEGTTGPVPGEGPDDARIMVIGEQPGDEEDLSGRPFVGPAGRLLDEALRRAGLVREAMYLTNAVKHFGHQVRGKRRLHQTPGQAAVEHCRWWLEQERTTVRPDLIITLGATAARAVLGIPLRMHDDRGTIRPAPDGTAVLPTFHPAYLLRLSDREAKREAWSRFLADLRQAADWQARRGRKAVPGAGAAAA
jgi:DNA polymerase